MLRLDILLKYINRGFFLENLTEIKRYSFEIYKQLCLLGKSCIFIPKKFLKYLSNRQQKDLMPKCKVFLFPSYYESFELPSFKEGIN